MPSYHSELFFLGLVVDCIDSLFPQDWFPLCLTVRCHGTTERASLQMGLLMDFSILSIRKGVERGNNVI